MFMFKILVRVGCRCRTPETRRNYTGSRPGSRRRRSGMRRRRRRSAGYQGFLPRCVRELAGRHSGPAQRSASPRFGIAGSAPRQVGDRSVVHSCFPHNVRVVIALFRPGPKSIPRLSVGRPARSFEPCRTAQYFNHLTYLVECIDRYAYLAALSWLPVLRRGASGSTTTSIGLAAWKIMRFLNCLLGCESAALQTSGPAAFLAARTI